MTLLTRCFLRVLVGVQGRHAACRYIIGKQCCYCLILLFGLARITWMWLWPIDAIYTNRYRRYTKSNFLLVYYILVHVLLPVIWFYIPPPPRTSFGVLIRNCIWFRYIYLYLYLIQDCSKHIYSNLYLNEYFYFTEKLFFMPTLVYHVCTAYHLHVLG